MTQVTSAEQLFMVRQLTLNGEARRIREAAGLSQAEIGRAIAADASTVARWERGERAPRGDVALQYARLLTRLAKATEAVAS